MHTKWMACSAVLVLLAGSGAFGITIQNQVFNVGSANTIDLTQGIQSASSAQNLTIDLSQVCLLYTSPSPRDRTRSRMPSSA